MRLSMPLLVTLAVLLPLASIVAQDVEPRPFTAEDVQSTSLDSHGAVRT